MSNETLAKLQGICEQIEMDSSFRISESFQVDGESASNADNYAKFLTSRGFKYRQTGSQCKVATAEHHLEKNGLRVEIISSNFFGPFVQIEIRK